MTFVMGPALLFCPADRPERYLVAERVREAVIYETAEELPYVTAVEIERSRTNWPTSSWSEGAPAAAT